MLTAGTFQTHRSSARPHTADGKHCGSSDVAIYLAAFLQLPQPSYLYYAAGEFRPSLTFRASFSI